jgi:RNA polymerase sigma factor (sigma-70 family)
VGDPHLAEEVTQTVFIILARKAASLGQDTILPSWLHRTAVYVAADALKSRHRRARRDQEAHMQSLLNDPTPATDETWPQIAPLLDNAIAGLNASERHAIVLRYFENRSLAEVGHALGANEDAARMRVNRALEKLRKFFAKSGVTSTTAIIAGAISANSIHAAPTGLANSVTAVAITKGAAVGGSTLTLIKGALKLMAWTKAKTTVAIGLAVVLAAGTMTILVIQIWHEPRPKPMPPGVTDYPRSSWVFAGYADPQAALMSYMWARACQTNREVFTATLTPAQKNAYETMIRYNRLLPQPHSEAATVADTFKRSSDEWQNGGYQILDQQSVSADRVLVHVDTRSTLGEAEEHVSMSKIGNEWKYDGIPGEIKLRALNANR